MASLHVVVFTLCLHCISTLGEDIIIASAPNLIRVGHEETVLVTIQREGPNLHEAVDVTVRFTNEDGTLINETSVSVPNNLTVTSRIAKLFVNPANIPNREREDRGRYVNVHVQCGDVNEFNQVKRVLLSSEGGFLFIQTDKPIYTPVQTAMIRLISLDQQLSPKKQQIQLDIRTPQDVVIKRRVFSKDQVKNGVIATSYKLPEEPLFGNWSLVVYYGKDLGTNKTVQFEVKEYVLPTFHVHISPPDFILPSSQRINVDVEARYVYNKPVQGRSFLKIGIMEQDGEITMFHSDDGSLVNGLVSHDIDLSILGDHWFEDNIDKVLFCDLVKDRSSLKLQSSCLHPY